MMCLNCKKRFKGCRATCKDYLEYKTKISYANRKATEERTRECIIRRR